VKKTHVLAATLLALVATGCRPGPSDDQATGTMRAEDIRAARQQLAPEVREQLDSGNAAYSAERYEDALRHYQTAARLDESSPAAWFGIYMAESARGNPEQAEAAIRRAHDLAPESSLIEPGTP
jgi:tetratricopeptide (TPR) repeat protein